MESRITDKRKEAMVVDIDMLVPKEHLLRKIDKVMDYEWLYARLEPYYKNKYTGRPNADPVVLIKMVLIQHLYGIRSLRQTWREIDMNIAYRWFLGYDLLESIPHFATVSYAFCQRFPAELSQEIFEHHVRDSGQLRELIQQYAVAFCHAVQENQRNDYSPYVKRALQYIELQFSRPIEAEDLSKMNNITQQYFSEIFKKETGKTVKQYIMQARCDRAAELLEGSSLPIQEISHYVGYEDTNYFARVFKKLKGVSPQEYRKQKAIY